MEAGKDTETHNGTNGDIDIEADNDTDRDIDARVDADATDPVTRLGKKQRRVRSKM
jgi:hypothetical protein